MHNSTALGGRLSPSSTISVETIFRRFPPITVLSGNLTLSTTSIRETYKVSDQHWKFESPFSILIITFSKTRSIPKFLTINLSAMPKADSPPATPMEVALPVKSIVEPVSALDAAVGAATQRYIARNPTSKKLFEQACDYLPGGNTRTLLYSAPFPLCMKRGESYKVFDEDGHE